MQAHDNPVEQLKKIALVRHGGKGYYVVIVASVMHHEKALRLMGSVCKTVVPIINGMWRVQFM